ncbi:insulinase family protein, partial [Patescibacteria group bacterium]|nr:insulinase family protein [Patescibacteria group bacterium]
MIHFEKKVLNNGLRVFAAPMKNTEAVTLLVLVGVGSRHETKKINGISHFLEHLFFKGTKNRPKAGEVFKELDRMGASYNAFTSKENTEFWVKSSVGDFDESLDIVSDILQESIFKEEEIEKERGVILQEISMYEDEPRKKVLDVIENVIYGDQPVGWDIIGTKENVRVIRRADIIDFKLKNYFSKNIVVVVAGGIDEKIIFQKVEKAFDRLDNGKNKSYKKTLVF